MEEVNKIPEKFLPIGTVVSITGQKVPLMISGYRTENVDKKDKIWDYSGCIFPIGFVSSKQTFLFDHNQIEKVVFLGYETEQEHEFINELKTSLDLPKMK